MTKSGPVRSGPVLSPGLDRVGPVRSGPVFGPSAHVYSRARSHRTEYKITYSVVQITLCTGNGTKWNDLQEVRSASGTTRVPRCKGSSWRASCGIPRVLAGVFELGTYGQLLLRLAFCVGGVVGASRNAPGGAKGISPLCGSCVSNPAVAVDVGNDSQDAGAVSGYTTGWVLEDFTD